MNTDRFMVFSDKTHRSWQMHVSGRNKNSHNARREIECYNIIIYYMIIMPIGIHPRVFIPDPKDLGIMHIFTRTIVGSLINYRLWSCVWPNGI